MSKFNANEFQDMTRAEGMEYLKQFNYTELKKIAKSLYIPNINKNTVAELIVEATIGNRLKFEALANIDLGRW